MSIGLVLLGLAAGVLSGMAAGGGTILVPGLVLLFGITQHRAQGAVLAAFLLTQSVAVIGQWLNKRIRLKHALWMIPGAAVGALAGAWMAARTRPEALRQIYGWHLLLLGAVSLIDFSHGAKVHAGGKSPD